MTPKLIVDSGSDVYISNINIHTGQIFWIMTDVTYISREEFEGAPKGSITATVEEDDVLLNITRVGSNC